MLGHVVAGGAESGGGGDGGDGGSFGGGGGDWSDGWDGSENPDEALSEGFWIWQASTACVTMCKPMPPCPRCHG